jgi:hypothetical protein
MAENVAGPGEAPDGAARRQIKQQAMPAGVWRRSLLGVGMVALGLAMFAVLLTIWSAVEKASTPSSSSANSIEVSFFGWWTPTLSSGTVILLLVVVAGSLGSYIHMVTSFVDYVGNRKLTLSWTWWYLLRVFIGAALAVLLYFAFRGGLFSSSSQTNVVNPYGIAALAGLAGMFHKKATDKMEEVFGVLFPSNKDDERADSLSNPVPRLDGLSPASLPAGARPANAPDLVITLRGDGFVVKTQARVTRAGESEQLSRELRSIGTSVVQLQLLPEDVAAPATFQITLVNPAPGGGVSESMQLTITEAPGA